MIETGIAGTKKARGRETENLYIFHESVDGDGAKLGKEGGVWCGNEENER